MKGRVLFSWGVVGIVRVSEISKYVIECERQHHHSPVPNYDWLVALHLCAKLHVVHQVPLASGNRAEWLRDLSMDHLATKSQGQHA